MKDYRVILFRNGKIMKVFFEHNKEEYVLKCWNDLHEALPNHKFPRKFDNPPSKRVIFELALIYPKNTKKF